MTYYPVDALARGTVAEQALAWNADPDSSDPVAAGDTAGEPSPAAGQVLRFAVSPGAVIDHVDRIVVALRELGASETEVSSDNAELMALLG